MSAIQTGEDRMTTTHDKGPIVLDLGRKKRKSIKALRNGKGKLLDEVMATVQELRTAGTISQNAQPVVIVVRERPKTNGILPMLGM